MEFRSSKQKHQPMGRPTSKPNLSLCQKHPKHQQSPGVCSVCLNERLSKLPRSSRSTTRAADSSCSSSSLSSLSSSHYSASASSCSSPVHHHHHRHYPVALEGKGFSMTLFKSGKTVLTKSQSVASGVKKRDAEGQVGIDDHGKKKSSFWSKLLRPKNKRIDAGLSRSRTTNERAATKVL